MTPLHSVDESAGLLRFTVHLGPEPVTAFISRSTWRALALPGHRDASLRDAYLHNQHIIDAAVVLKIRNGANAPVVLRASDF